MKRERLPFVPVWGGAYERYAQGWVHSQGWRLEAIVGGYEDQMQECALIFAKLAGRYQAENAKHFMALFKRALMNHWADKSPKDWMLRNSDNPYQAYKIDHARVTKQEYADELQRFNEYRTANASREEELQENENSNQFAYPEAELACELEKASHELVEVVKLILNAPAELLGVLWGNDENITVQERRLCRMAGVACKPVLTELRALISGA